MYSHTVNKQNALPTGGVFYIDSATEIFIRASSAEEHGGKTMKQKRSLAFLLSFAMLLSLFPALSPAVSAAATKTEKNITLGIDTLEDGDSRTPKYDYVYYGDGNDPVKWRVLSTAGNGDAYYENTPYTPVTEPDSPEDGKVYTDTDKNQTRFVYLSSSDSYYKQTSATGLFLLSDECLGRVRYDFSDHDDRKTYQSDWRYSKAWKWCVNSVTMFTESERKYLLKTSKANDAGDVYTNELKADTLFLCR